jgi:hypothetical protein
MMKIVGNIERLHVTEIVHRLMIVKNAFFEITTGQQIATRNFSGHKMISVLIK